MAFLDNFKSKISFKILIKEAPLDEPPPSPAPMGMFFCKVIFKYYIKY